MMSVEGVGFTKGKFFFYFFFFLSVCSKSERKRVKVHEVHIYVRVNDSAAMPILANESLSEVATKLGGQWT
jgi:hypothetical protein